MDDSKTDPMTEITAMQKLAEALSSLDTDAVARVLRWAADRYSVSFSPAKKNRGSASESPAAPDYEGGENGTIRPQFNDLAELYNAASPTTEADKALVVGYWFQFMENQADFVAQAVNSALKNLGHGVSNITNAFEALKAQKPALVMQVKKSGTTKQARKRYKLTSAGKSAVEMLVGQQ